MKPRLKILPIMCALVFLCWTAMARKNDSWIEVRSPHFTVASNADEKEARRTANQFEEIRAVFHSNFPTLRVDAGKPLTVIAVKDENSLKTLLPDFWTTKDAMHPSGEYREGADEIFAVFRTDLWAQTEQLLSRGDAQKREAENPYSAVFENYAYAILRLNFSSLPLWLRTGIAEFYANTLVESFKTDVGLPRRAQIALLQRSQPLTLDRLMSADMHSPLYSERDQAPLFYSESWAIVHYLTFDPEAIKQQYLAKYMNAWDATQDGVEAARRTFGDLNRFQTTISNYSRQVAFAYQRREPQALLSAKDFVTRPMSPAEALVVQADFLEHSAHGSEARPMLKEAMELQPDLPAAHTCMGYDLFVQFNNDDADKEFKRATALNPQDFRSLFYQAEILERKAGYTAESTPQMIAYLEKVIQINSNFAPAYAFLSVAYRQQPQTKQKALDAALKAHDLEPGMIAYVAEVGDALIALDRDAEARAVGDKLTKSAMSAQEKAMAQSYAKRLALYEEKVPHGNN